MAKCGRLRCGGLDIVEGLVKTVDVFGKSISEGQGGADISKCALQKTHEETLCIPGRNIPFQACYYYCCYYLLAIIFYCSNISLEGMKKPSKHPFQNS
jgi:hypothetical protein